MEPQKFVVRLLDDAGELLAWTEIYCVPHPQGRPRSCLFRPIGPTQFLIEKAGKATDITIHWCDLDITRRTQPLEHTHVMPGQVFTYAWIEPVWLVSGSSEEIVLPAVTERRSVTIGVPVGGLGVVSGR